MEIHRIPLYNRKRMDIRMKKWMRRITVWLMTVLCLLQVAGCGMLYTSDTDASGAALQYAAAMAGHGTAKQEKETEIDGEGEYTSKEDVALYIHTYDKLPKNFITKKEANKLGWQGGKLEPYAPGKSIGGDRFGNYEGALPEKKGRSYKECDIDTKGQKRGTKRIVFSNDGLIYYTDDHYETFTLLYGEE